MSEEMLKAHNDGAVIVLRGPVVVPNPGRADGRWPMEFTPRWFGDERPWVMKDWEDGDPPRFSWLQVEILEPK